MSTTKNPRQELHDDVLARLQRGEPGDDVARAFSLGAEQLIGGASGALPQGVALLAQGGLARRELVPFADVDVLVLLDDGLPADDVEKATAPLYALWDAGFKVGHAVRKVSELEALFSNLRDKDGHAATALLEARFVAGDRALADRALKEARRDWFPSARAALTEEKKREIVARREKFGTSPFVQEPDIKSGAGGLRDIHGLLWIGLLQVGEGGRAGDGDLVAGLLSAGFLRPREASALVQGRRVLTGIRAALHLAVGRGDDRLHAAHAEKAAALLAAGAADVDAAEQLVQRALRAMGIVKRTVDDALARLAPSRRGARRDLGGGFVEVDGALHVFQTDANDPLTVAALVDAERLMSERDLVPSEALSSRRAAFVETASGADASAALVRLASSAFARAGASAGPFTRLVEHGVLALALEDMARLAQRVRLDGVHALTTDAHLARCADLALALTTSSEAPPAPLAASLARTTRPHLLVLGALFHDMGKGLPEDHSIAGARIVQREGARMGLPADEIDLLVFLVEGHLLLSRTSQRRDLSDPKVIDEIAAAVRTPERLDLLALLTWVDMCAVAPGVGTEWKARLLGTAVERTRALLLDPAGAVHRRVDDDVRARALVALPDSDAARRFVDGASVRFLAARGDDELRRDLEVFAQQQREAHAVVDVRAAPGHVHEVRVAARDRPGFLADIAAALASEGANVLDAALDVRSDGAAFDCFVIDDGRGGRLDDGVARALPAVVARAAERSSGLPTRSHRRSAHTQVTPRVRVLPADSWGRTVVEVRAADRLGLLADLAGGFAALGFTIALARIHTEGPRVTDVFTVDRVDARAATAQELADLQRALLAVV